MDRNNRKRRVYVAPKQKKKMIEMITKHPQLISGKITQDFSNMDAQKMWVRISNECNSIPGARKTWRQWRKTWQDIKSKTKKKYADSNVEDASSSVVLLTQAEQEALGLKDVSSTSNCQEITLVTPENNIQEESFLNEEETNTSYSDSPESPVEEKVFTHSIGDRVSNMTSDRKSSKDKKHTNCAFNCDILAEQEERKLKIKEDYLNFKKDYLRQKLQIMKEQSAALQHIAKELYNK